MDFGGSSLEVRLEMGKSSCALRPVRRLLWRLRGVTMVSGGMHQPVPGTEPSQPPQVTFSRTETGAVLKHGREAGASSPPPGETA